MSGVSILFLLPPSSFQRARPEGKRKTSKESASRAQENSPRSLDDRFAFTISSTTKLDDDDDTIQVSVGSGRAKPPPGQRGSCVHVTPLRAGVVRRRCFVPDRPSRTVAVAALYAASIPLYAWEEERERVLDVKRSTILSFFFQFFSNKSLNTRGANMASLPNLHSSGYPRSTFLYM